MNTSLKNGTGVGNLIRGARRYVESHGKATLAVDYYGWRHGAPPNTKRGEVPSINRMQEALQAPHSAVILNIGWYEQPPQEAYRRCGGHWVLLAAYDPSHDNRYFVIDPSPRAGPARSVQEVSLHRIAGGKLTGSKRGLPTSAAGHLRIEGDLKAKPDADVAIVDAVVIVALEPA